ncbi:MAG: tRNA (adenosine(37)-N6)-threonylcarbamoyltransferase complex ATPase subunit type 1 TsaE [Lachnospiraceae bacterium]|nr:tRNA (adenosine(37)-N6)-threonylcarbamoyltransferase complex ATPase subunit type 1 TsaE [Lachnospiraceae bacterium]
MIIRTKNKEETADLGARFAETLEPGDIVCLLGDLGTGKTTFTKAVAAGLGVTEEITSPTFNIVNIYTSGRLPLYHFDVYRMSGPEEFDATGAGEYFDGEGVCVIEWADQIEELIPDGCFLVEIEYGTGETERIFRFSKLRD